MGIKAAFRFQGNQKEFMKIFQELCYSRQPWEVWSDVVTMMACSIANAADRMSDRHESREKEYEQCLKRVGSVDKPAQLFAAVVNALEEDPEQDFLGQMYMGLNLGNHWKGQFFTPYNVCRMMAEMNFGDGAKAEAESKGYLSVCDPCIGAGAMLIAAANTMRRAGINYQTSAVFVGQDVDRVVALMAYIQLSLLGCPGYIIVGNSLLHPPVGHVLFPQETEGQELWIMPMFQTDTWNIRRLAVMMDNICGAAATEKPAEKERYFMFFDFMNRRYGMETKNLPIVSSRVELSEKSREALQSDTWQKAKEAMENEVSKTDGEAQAGAEESGRFAQGAWKGALNEYLRTSYKDGESMCDIESGGAVYKVMKKDDKVTFYDAAGSTLFHISYEQLEKEYAELMERQGMESADCQIKREIEEDGEEGLKCSGDAGEKCGRCDKDGPVQPESPGAEDMDKDHTPVNPSGGKETSGPAKDQSKKKLEKELKKAKDKSFAEPVIEYLIKRCGEDEGLSQDVVQEHKTWEKCYGYIYSQAQKSVQKGARSCAVRDDIVYEWAEDYYHRDDKAEEEKKAKEAAERKKKEEERKKKASGQKKADKKNPKQAAKKADHVEEKPVEPPKPKKNQKEMDGQMDMFSMMGI